MRRRDGRPAYAHLDTALESRSIVEEADSGIANMIIRHDVIEAIGNTPLIKLKHASEATGCTILGKCEFLNPGQSVKDRAALFIIQDAIRRGRLKRGGVVSTERPATLESVLRWLRARSGCGR